MPWIMIINRPATRPSPPKLAIFWAEPWPDDLYAPEQARRCLNCGLIARSDEDIPVSRKRKAKLVCACEDGPNLPTAEDTHIYHSSFGKEPNFIGAMRIHYAGQDLRVFPHEFNRISPENMRLYVFGEPSIQEPTNSHILIPESPAAQFQEREIEEGDLKVIRDAALLDGCNPEQAYMTAMGIDITDMIEFPPIGWYKVRPEYGLIWCSEEELKEIRETADMPLEEVEP